MSETNGSPSALAAKPAFVFVHGGWHNSGCWVQVTPHLAEAGFASIPVDLIGAGADARFPSAFFKRPLDKAAYAKEPGPVAAITQAQRSEAVIATVRQAANAGGGKVVLAAHSMGGLTITQVAEAVPELIHAVVYITSFMIPPGMSFLEMNMHPTNEAALVPKLFLADPAVAKVIRIDPRSEDPDYRATFKSAFFSDMTDEQAQAATNLLHCDEPASNYDVRSNMTKDRFGSLQRHYVRCKDDMAITLAAQDFMIEEVDRQLGGATQVHSLAASHSPFFSMPKALADILVAAAG